MKMKMRIIRACWPHYEIWSLLKRNIYVNSTPYPTLPRPKTHSKPTKVAYKKLTKLLPSFVLDHTPTTDFQFSKMSTVNKQAHTFEIEKFGHRFVTHNKPV